LLQSDGRNLLKGKRKENKIIIIREWEMRGGRKALNLKGKTEWRGKQNGGRIKFSFKWENNKMGCSRFG